MAVSVIPIDPAQPEHSVRVRLEGRFFYRLAFKWNTRGQWWTMDVASDDGAALARGLRIVTGYNILRPHTAERFPPGAIVAVDVTGNMVPPTRDDFGRRVLLCYVSSDQVVRR